MDAKDIVIPSSITDSGTRRFIGELIKLIASLQERIAKLEAN